MLRSGPGWFFQGLWKNVFSRAKFFKLFLSLALTSTIYQIIIVTGLTSFPFKNNFFEPAQPLNKLVKTFDLTLSKLNTLNLNAQIHKAGSFQNLKNSENFWGACTRTKSLPDWGFIFQHLLWHHELKRLLTLIAMLNQPNWLTCLPLIHKK